MVDITEQDCSNGLHMNRKRIILEYCPLHNTPIEREKSIVMNIRCPYMIKSTNESDEECYCIVSD